MMDTKKAYATLGLDENATDEEVEKRYTVLLLRSKKQSAGQDPGAPSMDEITKAYNFIKGIAIEEEIRKKEPKNKTF
jgi:DnaJ-class molecular chaperone